MFGCENYGYDGNMDLCTNSMAQTSLSVSYFVSFVLVGTMIFLNLFIGVIMEGMDEAKAEMALLDAEEDPSHEIHVKELEEKMAEMHDLFIKFKNQHPKV